jgi:hypothetical protein
MAEEQFLAVAVDAAKNAGEVCPLLNHSIPPLPPPPCARFLVFFFFLVRS